MRIKSLDGVRYEVFVFESFSYKGKTRNKAHKVGTAMPSVKGGLVMFIPPGISLSGRVMILPEKTPLDEVDLIEAYQSAADEHGI